MTGRRMIPATASSSIDIGASGAVTIDGDTTTIDVINATGVILYSGARVLVDFIEPSGAFILGVLSNPTQPFTNLDSTDWQQSAAITHTVTYAKTLLVGKLMCVRFYLTATSAGTASSIITVGGLPTISDNNSVGGSWRYLDAGGSPAVYAGTVIGSNSTTVKFSRDAVSNSLGVTDVTVASGDVLEAWVFYEVA